MRLNPVDSKSIQNESPPAPFYPVVDHPKPQSTSQGLAKSFESFAKSIVNGFIQGLKSLHAKISAMLFREKLKELVNDEKVDQLPEIKISMDFSNISDEDKKILEDAMRTFNITNIHK